MSDLISRQALCEYALNQKDKSVTPNDIMRFPSAQSGFTNEYNLKKIYNIYVKIAQAHFVYQPSKPKAITAMPFDWLEVQNLLEKYLEDHGADFDALCSEYVSENVKDDHSLSAQPEQTKYEYHYDHTDCIWYRPEARNRCPTTCAQYRDGKGYRPYRRDKQYEE